VTARTRTRALARLALTACAGGLALALGISAVWLTLGQPEARGTTWFQVTGLSAQESSHYTGAPTDPFFFLALGNDARADGTAGLGDAIHVIGVNPATGQATIMNVPRDTVAPGGDKINAWHATRGLPGITDQLNRMFGIQIQYAITTNFPGFTAMIDEIGGIDVDIPQQLHDTDSGATFVAGVQHLMGRDILAFARDRKDFINGDISRTFNQGQIILGALATLRAQNPGAAGTMKLVAILARHVQMHNVSLAELFRLGRLGLDLDAANVRNVTIPVASAGDGTTNLRIVGADSLFADFRDDGVLQAH
jgi:LCP family protein required for cell wall assembly